MSWLQRLQEAKATVSNISVLVQSEPSPMAANDCMVVATFHETFETLTLPYGDKRTAVEADRFTARVVKFQNMGADLLKAEGLAETLHRRDHDLDRRRMCAECRNLRGTMCHNPRGAALGRPNARMVDVSPLRFMLQHCEGFAVVHPRVETPRDYP